MMKEKAMQLIGKVKLGAKRNAPELLLGGALVPFGSILVSKILLPEDEKAFLKNFAPFISNNNIDLITELFEESINQIERNGNASLIFLDDSFKIFNYFFYR